MSVGSALPEGFAPGRIRTNDEESLTAGRVRMADGTLYLLPTAAVQTIKTALATLPEIDSRFVTVPYLGRTLNLFLRHIVAIEEKEEA